MKMTSKLHGTYGISCGKVIILERAIQEKRIEGKMVGKIGSLFVLMCSLFCKTRLVGEGSFPVAPTSLSCV
jgi:hypothetical protein